MSGDALRSISRRKDSGSSSSRYYMNNLRELFGCVYNAVSYIYIPEILGTTTAFKGVKLTFNFS